MPYILYTLEADTAKYLLTVTVNLFRVKSEPFGCWPLAIGRQQLAVGYQLLAVSFSAPAARENHASRPSAPNTRKHFLTTDKHIARRTVVVSPLQCHKEEKIYSAANQHIARRTLQNFALSRDATFRFTTFALSIDDKEDPLPPKLASEEAADIARTATSKTRE